MNFKKILACATALTLSYNVFSPATHAYVASINELSNPVVNAETHLNLFQENFDDWFWEYNHNMYLSDDCNDIEIDDVFNAIDRMYMGIFEEYIVDLDTGEAFFINYPEDRLACIALMSAPGHPLQRIPDEIRRLHDESWFQEWAIYTLGNYPRDRILHLLNIYRRDPNLSDDERNFYYSARFLYSRLIQIANMR